MVSRSQDSKVGRAQMALWKIAASDDPTLESVYPSDDPAYVQRRVTKYRSQVLKSPDDPVQGGGGSSSVIGGVSQRGVSS